MAERNLYRVFFAIGAINMIGSSVRSFKSLLIETPDPYIGTDLQVKSFEVHAFKYFEKLMMCSSSKEVVYVGKEKIPNIPETAEMKPDVQIEGARWC